MNKDIAIALSALGKADQFEAGITSDFHEHISSYRKINDGIHTLNEEDLVRVIRLASFAMCYIAANQILKRGTSLSND